MQSTEKTHTNGKLVELVVVNSIACVYLLNRRTHAVVCVAVSITNVALSMPWCRWRVSASTQHLRCQ